MVSRAILHQASAANVVATYHFHGFLLYPVAPETANVQMHFVENVVVPGFERFLTLL